MKFVIFNHIFILLFLLISQKANADICNGGISDLCSGYKCDEYITVDFGNDSIYPSDGYWDPSTNQYKCPDDGCKMCGIDASGNKADDCFSPFSILNMIAEGTFKLKATTTILYNQAFHPRSCGPKNYKDVPIASKVFGWMGISIPKKDGFSRKTEKSFYFDTSYNPTGSTKYIYAPYQMVGPGNHYMLQPRIEIIGNKKVMRFYISQGGWHVHFFQNIDGTYTSDYWPISNSSNMSSDGFTFNHSKWRRMIICDDYNDWDKEDGAVGDQPIGMDYRSSDERFCYVKRATWNKLWDVQQGGYYDCDQENKSGLNIVSHIDKTSDSARKIDNVCQVNVDKDNARDLLSSGIVLPAKAGQYNFLDILSEYKGGGYSVVTEPIFNISEATNSTYLTPLIDVNVTGGNPNVGEETNFTMNLGGTNFEYQDGYFKYRLITVIENNNYPGSKPEICLYGCQTNNASQCIKSSDTLDDMILNETDKALLDYNKAKYLLTSCFQQKTIDTEDSVQDYKIYITGLGLGSTYEDPRVKFTITNTRNTSETVTKTLYLRSYEDNSGEQKIPYDDRIFEYENENEIPAYQELIDDPYNYLNYDFTNTYYALSDNVDESIFTYLVNQNNQKLVVPFLFNNQIIYNSEYTMINEDDTIISQPCDEFHATTTNNEIINVCDNQDADYYKFLCINNLYNEFYEVQENGGSSFPIRDSLYTTNNDLISNDYFDYLNSSEYNELDPTFPIESPNLCIPKYIPIDFRPENFNYELNNTGINDATIILNMTRYDGTDRTFNGRGENEDLDVPLPDYTSKFDYQNFDLSQMATSTVNNYCEASTNSSSTDIRYDYYHKFLFKVYNDSGFIYVCYKQYDAPDSSSLADNWSMITAYTFDYSTGNKIYTDFINLNICPTYDGDDISDFLSCTGESAAHYERDGVERWCSCSSRTVWSDYSTNEQNADWSQQIGTDVQVKARCMMDGSWEMTSGNAYCPVYCNADESGENGAEMPRTLAVEGENVGPISVICQGGKSLYGGSRTYQCSGKDDTAGNWINASGSGQCKSNCGDAYYYDGGGSASSSSYHIKFPSTGLLTADKTVTVDCKRGYFGTGTATCDYDENKWVDVSVSCSSVTCPSGWQSAGSFDWYYLTYMKVASGGHDCQGNDVSYNINRYPLKVHTSSSAIDQTQTISCRDGTNVKYNGSTGTKAYVASGNITARCQFSGTGNSASASWSITHNCTPNCYDLQDGYYQAPGSYDGNLRNNNEYCGKDGLGRTKKRNRWCTGSCSSNGTWVSITRHEGSCKR